VVGQGRLVGGPVSKMLEASGAKVSRIDAGDDRSPLKTADIIITGVGQPKLITAEQLKPGALVIDAGTAEVSGKVVGDVDPGLYDNPDFKITPVPGGVGPLTVAALFDNLLIAASVFKTAST
jgi:methylenetetrahydrofolate dehydrogenase (NADP+)/methenyltetrahydrofolate cyclohydrolase